MQETGTAPRRQLDFEDYLDILRRNAAWLIGPAFAGLVAATVIAYLMPDNYVSTAYIRVVPQQISTELVHSVSSQDMADHISGMAETILSRNTLTSIINNYGLYKSEQKSEPLEDVISRMRQKSIQIRPTVGFANLSGRNVPAVMISFSYSDRYVAQRVCGDIVSRFMTENSTNIAEGNQVSSDFLKDETDAAKRELDELEQKLESYRSANAGRLPEEMQMNISQMNALDSRLSTLNDQASRNNQQRMLLETDLHSAQARLAAVKDYTPQAQVRTEKLNELDKQIDTLKTVIASLKERYTEDYPDLQNAQQQLKLLQAQREQAASDKPKGDGAAAPNRERLDAQQSIDQVEALLRANALEAQQIGKEIQQVGAELRTYQGRVSTMPAGEKEYADLMRDRDLAKQRFVDLKHKLEASSISVDMERRKQGETLELLDTASLPTAPKDPKRETIIPIGLFAGLILGAVVVAVREVKDTSLKSLKDARLYTLLPVLGSVPLLENDLVVNRRRQIAWISWAVATLAGLAIMVGAAAHYYLSKA